MGKCVCLTKRINCRSVCCVVEGGGGRGRREKGLVHRMLVRPKPAPGIFYNPRNTKGPGLILIDWAPLQGRAHGAEKLLRKESAILPFYN